MLRLLLFSTLTAGLLVAARPSAAQPSSGGPTPSSPTTVPIDGGASLLLASGVALSLKKLHQVRQRRRPRA